MVGSGVATRLATRSPEGPLAEIPLVDVVEGGPLALLDLQAERLATLLGAARRRYGAVILRLGDRATRQWLARSRNPYSRELAAVAERVGTPGAFLLNLSYEWACTSGVAADPGADPLRGGSRMLRTLDWPMDEIGRTVIVARQNGGAGIYYAVTWPGYTGVLTALAPGRFAIAINQPPMRRHSGALWFDWLVNRTVVWRGLSLPPSHLARAVCDTALTYADAKRQLIGTPVCIPAFYILAGTAPGEGCVIERTETRAVVHELPAAIANHWLKLKIPGRDRGTDSAGRYRQMEALLDQPDLDDFGWIRPPILNRTTRLAVIANAATGALRVRGYEHNAPATRIFNLADHGSGETERTTPAS